MKYLDMIGMSHSGATISIELDFTHISDADEMYSEFLKNSAKSDELLEMVMKFLDLDLRDLAEDEE